MLPDEGTRRKLTAILSADVVGYSRLMGQDERATVHTLKTYRAAIGHLVERHHGRVVNAPGDALLAEFPSAVEAVQSAVEIQRHLKERNAILPAERQMRYRIGVNLGDVIEEADGTLYGDGVNVAARLESVAQADGICVSGKVFEEVEGKVDVGFDFAGEQEVKNIAKPLRVYRVQAGGGAASSRARVHALWQGWRRSLITTAVAIVLVGAGLAAWPVVRARQAAMDPALVMPTGPSIAVLPFANLGGDPKQGYFTDGITEQIITELTRFRNLFVIARNSTFRYKGQAVDVRQVGRDLGARYVLEGSVRRAAQTIRVTAQLLDTRSGAHLWAESYERQLTTASILGLQDGITERVVGAIAGTYGVVSRATFEQAKGKAPASLDAYDCVLRWYEYQRVSISQPEHLRVRECLERAVKLDPNYADAWAMLSWAYVEEHQQGFNPRPNPLGRALDAARRAIDLAPNHQRGHEALAIVHFFRRDLDAFFPLAERAVRLNPNNENTLAEMGTLIVYSNWTNRVRRERGLALVKKAMALNPSYPSWYHLPVAWVHWWKGEHDLALAEAKRIDLPDYFWSHKLLAVVYAGLGRKEEAAAAVANVLKLRPDMPVAVRAEWRKWNVPEEVIDRAIADLRRAGMNIPPGT